jgi:hypothetical protein
VSLFSGLFLEKSSRGQFEESGSPQSWTGFCGMTFGIMTQNDCDSFLRIAIIVSLLTMYTMYTMRE